MSQPQIVKPRQFCECGRPVYKKRCNVWICRRCFDMESLYDQVNTARENRAGLGPSEPKSKLGSGTEERHKREMQYAEPYRVHLQHD